MHLATFVHKDVLNCDNCYMYEKQYLMQVTYDGVKLCQRCAIRMNYCEDCGSTKLDGEIQRHYDERCVLDWAYGR